VAGGRRQGSGAVLAVGFGRARSGPGAGARRPRPADELAAVAGAGVEVVPAALVVAAPTGGDGRGGATSRLAVGVVDQAMAAALLD